MNCPKCGFKTDKVFCGNCGNQILSNKTTYLPNEQMCLQSEDKNNKLKNKKMHSCKTCGYPISKNAKRCPNCDAKNKKAVYKRTWFWILAILAIVLSVYMFINSDLPYMFSNKEIVATITPRNISYAAWLDLDNSLKSDSDFESLSKRLDGKYVSMNYCYITYISDKHIVVRDINDPQTVRIYLAKDQIDQLSRYDEGDVIDIVGRVKAVNGFSGSHFELRDASITNIRIFY